jgi:uncharacterized protein (TIGR03435 family)
MLRFVLFSIFAFTLLISPLAVAAQSNTIPAQPTAEHKTTAVPAPELPTFDVVAIKPPDPAAEYRKMGFYGQPGGRIFFGGFLKMLVANAFNMEDYQIAGGPDWITSQWFDINAVPPERSPARAIEGHNAEPSPEQRLMLQSLLRDRFHFKSHIETRQGEVYILTRGKKPLQLHAPQNQSADPRAIVYMKEGDIDDGEALGENTTTDYMATNFSRYLKLPVLNQTGVTGSYDFSLPPVDPENHDIVNAVFSVVHRLGFEIHRGRGPIQTLIIDHAEQPTEN